MSRSRLLATVAAVVFALGAATWQAAMHWTAQNPTPDAELAVGESVRVGGTTLTLDTFDVATRLPSNEDGEEWVEAPPGAVLVQVTYTSVIDDDDVDPETHYCYPTAVDGEGHKWRTDSTIGYRVQAPGYSCAGTVDDPIEPGVPLTAGAVFLVPADVADTLVVDLDLYAYDERVRLTR
jgi:hypothetical protein